MHKLGDAGYTQTFKAFHAIGFKAPDYTVMRAITHKNLELLKYFKENGYPMEQAKKNAMIKGDLDIIQIVCDKDDVMDLVAKYNSLGVVKKLYDCGYKFTGYAIIYASESKHRDTVEWLKEKGLKEPNIVSKGFTNLYNKITTMI